MKKGPVRASMAADFGARAVCTEAPTHRLRCEWLGRGASLGVVALLVCLVACGGSSLPERPNVILISLDTLRADAVGARHGRPSLTPNIDAFAASATTFSEVFTTIPLTSSAHMTMLTGHHHAVHGVKDMGSTLPAGIPTLAELLAQRGYATVGRYTTLWLKPELGFGRGFDSYEFVEDGPTYAWRVNSSAIESMEVLRRGGRPFFAFLHYYDPHSDVVPQSGSAWPYYAPAEYLTAPPPPEEDFCTDAGQCATEFLIACNRDGTDLSEAISGSVRHLYEAGVRATDAAIGELLRYLEDTGLTQRSVILITSDHGEEFREHGRFLHSQVYEESVAVPLIVHFPAQRRRVGEVGGPVDLREVFAIVEHVTRPDATRDRPTATSLPFGGGPILMQDKNRAQTWAMVEDGWRVVVDRRSDMVELYDRGADPGDRHDLAGLRPEVAEGLRGQLEERVHALMAAGERLAAQHPPDGGALLSPEERARLRSLGYLD